jgi:hypothetical protein
MRTLDEVLDLLVQFKQRATYGAVAGVVGGNPRTVMSRQTKSFRSSWVVSSRTDRKLGAKRGWPTGYSAAEVDPELFERSHVIRDRRELARWLRNPQ